MCAALTRMPGWTVNSISMDNTPGPLRKDDQAMCDAWIHPAREQYGDGGLRDDIFFRRLATSEAGLLLLIHILAEP